MTIVNIVDALATLDPQNDDHWTSDGLPRMDVLEALCGHTLTRADVTAAAKGFSRRNPTLAVETPVEESIDDKPEDGAEDKAETEPAPRAPVTAAEPENELAAAIAKAEAEVAATTKSAAEAQAAHSKALANLDVLIRKRDELERGLTSAESIKAFQASQHAQRAAAANMRRALLENV